MRKLTPIILKISPHSIKEEIGSRKEENLKQSAKSSFAKPFQFYDENVIILYRVMIRDNYG